MHHRAFLGVLTIPNAGTDSNVLSANELKIARALVFESPAAFTGTVSVLAGPDEASVFAALLPMKVDGVAAVLTAATADQWNVSPGAAVAIRSGVAEAAVRVVNVYAVLDT